MRAYATIPLIVALVIAPAALTSTPAMQEQRCTDDEISKLCPSSEPAGEPVTVLGVLSPDGNLSLEEVSTQFTDSEGSNAPSTNGSPAEATVADNRSGAGGDDPKRERQANGTDPREEQNDRADRRGDNRDVRNRTDDSDGDDENGTQSTVPCSDDSGPTAGCPDLTVDPTRFNAFISEEHFDEADCAVQEGQVPAGDRRLMRFTFTSPNFGDGDLIVGAPADHPEWFEWSDCHGHYHFHEYADYRLWTVEGYLEWKQIRMDEENETPEEVFEEHPEIEDEFIAGHKQGFCVIDVNAYIPFPPKYTSCATNQGISVGWADAYGPWLDGQWIDVTGVESGQYVLEAEVNPERLFVEDDYDDNAGAMLVRIPESGGQV